MYIVKLPMNESDSSLMRIIHKTNGLKLIKISYRGHKNPAKDRAKVLYLVGPRIDFPNQLTNTAA